MNDGIGIESQIGEIPKPQCHIYIYRICMKKKSIMFWTVPPIPHADPLQKMYQSYTLLIVVVTVAG